MSEEGVALVADAQRTQCGFGWSRGAWQMRCQQPPAHLGWDHVHPYPLAPWKVFDSCPQEPAPDRLTLFRRHARRQCACGEQATTLMLYGDSAEQAWGANSWCDRHAELGQAHPVAHAEPICG